MPPTMKVCPECDAEVYAFQLPRHLFKEHGIGDPPKTRGAKKSSGGGSASGVRHSAAADPPPADLEGSTGNSEVEVETVPNTDIGDPPRKPGMLERFRSRRGRGRGGNQAPVTAERAPRRPKKYGGRRVALDTDISDAWAFGGRRLERTAHFPTGRMLQYQAPAAGVILDRAVAGTLPDRIFFQPIARNRDKYEDVGFLLAGPLLTFSITATQQQLKAARDEGDAEAFEALVGKLQMQQEMFTWVLGAMLPRLAAGAKVAREKKEKADKLIAEAFPDLGDEDPVQVLITSLFTPPTFEEVHQNGNADRAAAPPDREGPIPV